MPDSIDFDCEAILGGQKSLLGTAAGEILGFGTRVTNGVETKTERLRQDDFILWK